MLSIDNITLDFVKYLFFFARKSKNNEQIIDLNGKILCNLFFESSTRTMLSFQTAMYRLGGEVINFNKDYSSLNKGETFSDTLKTMQHYADVFVLRHPKKDFIYQASNIIKKPIINAGNGDGEHPTQALLDLFTIFSYFDIFDYKKSFNILFIGDIKHSRTIHSLIKLIIKIFKNIHITLLPYCSELYPDNDLIELIEEHQKSVNIINNYSNLQEYDILYFTRLQKERLEEKLNKNIVYNFDIQFSRKHLENIKENAIILHPLPRNEELSTDIDNDNRCKYFEQVENGVYIRMAILRSIFS